MKKLQSMILFLLLFLFASSAQADNVIVASDRLTQDKNGVIRVTGKGSTAVPESSGGAQNELERSGITGTFSMWGQLIQRAMPSDEPLISSKTKSSHKP